MATPYLPNLGNAADNGPGHNALLQTYLRAGTYRVNVSASDSSGRLGVVARPAPLPSAGVLVPGESGRASLTEGRGVVFPIEIAEAGMYRLDLYGLGRTLTARLEDADGWPITKPGPVSRLDQQLAPGRYRLVVLPQDVDARVVARLRRVVPIRRWKAMGRIRFRSTRCRNSSGASRRAAMPRAFPTDGSSRSRVRPTWCWKPATA